jgi:hypothetical protein
VAARSDLDSSRGVSEARAAFLGDFSDIQIKSSAKTSTASFRNRKAYLSDDSPPEVSERPARGSDAQTTSRFPSGAQLNNLSSAEFDQTLATARIAGMSSPIRRRDVSVRGRATAPQIAHGDATNSQNSLYAPAGRRSARGRNMVFCACSRCPIHSLVIFLTCV